MPHQTENQDQSKPEKRVAGITDSEFILLDDIVFAPLHALAEANQRLQAQIITEIKNMGTPRQNGQEETIHLDNIKIAYDQIRADDEEGYSVDNLQVQVPLLSIIPLTNLNVEKAQIDFSTEVKAAINHDTDDIRINARICSPSQRDSDFLPKVSYKLQVSSMPATEGIMRLIDALSVNQVAKKLDTTPVEVNGALGGDEQKMMVQKNKQLKGKINQLKLLYQKITDIMSEQERLRQIGKETFEEDTYEFDRKKYKMAQSQIINQIMEYQDQLVDREISYGLDEESK